jgi:hypothetical protein
LTAVDAGALLADALLLDLLGPADSEAAAATDSLVRPEKPSVRVKQTARNLMVKRAWAAFVI